MEINFDTLDEKDLELTFEEYIELHEKQHSKDIEAIRRTSEETMAKLTGKIAVKEVCAEIRLFYNFSFDRKSIPYSIKCNMVVYNEPLKWNSFMFDSDNYKASLSDGTFLYDYLIEDENDIKAIKKYIEENISLKEDLFDLKDRYSESNDIPYTITTIKTGNTLETDYIEDKSILLKDLKEKLIERNKKKIEDAKSFKGRCFLTFDDEIYHIKDYSEDSQIYICDILDFNVEDRIFFKRDQSIRLRIYGIEITEEYNVDFIKNAIDRMKENLSSISKLIFNKQ